LQEASSDIDNVESLNLENLESVAEKYVLSIAGDLVTICAGL